MAAVLMRPFPIPHPPHCVLVLSYHTKSPSIHPGEHASPSKNMLGQAQTFGEIQHKVHSIGFHVAPGNLLTRMTCLHLQGTYIRHTPS